MPGHTGHGSQTFHILLECPYFYGHSTNLFHNNSSVAARGHTSRMVHNISQGSTLKRTEKQDTITP